MNLITKIKSINKNKISEFLRSQDFIKAVMMAIAMVIPITLGVMFDMLDMAKAVALGVFLTSPSDSTGSLSLKVRSILIAIILALTITVLLQLIKVPLGVLIPLIGLLIFGISYLSIYGFRASLIGFSGLFAMVLSFSPFADTDIPLYIHVGLIGLGGLWYTFLVILRHLIFPRTVTEYKLAESIKMTAEYLDIRSKLIDHKNDRRQLLQDLLDLQAELTESHETLRELLISKRKGTGKSNYQARRLLIFQELIDMLELAMANPVNYFKTDQIFARHPEKLEDFQRVMMAMSQRLNNISLHFNRPKKLIPTEVVPQFLNKIKNDLKEWENRRDSKLFEDLLILRNYWKYQCDQFGRIKRLEKLLTNQQSTALHEVKEVDRTSFLTKQDYNFSVLRENFSMQSVIFRHSLRIALVGMIGYSAGLIFEVEKPYWILLTVIVIMRPNFGLTKSRLKQRAIGTLIGGTFAFAIIMLFRDTTLYGVLSILSFVIGFSMVQRNYAAAASFITMYILFVYALLSPEVFDVIQFRVLDTLIGAGLAFGGNLLLWPSWEIKSIDKTLKEAIEANRGYLAEIALYYNTKSEASLTQYKLSRKKAFLMMSDLSSSFQRMTQEPKAQHRHKKEVFQLVMLMHSFLASLASLGTYITHNPTTPASKDFNEIAERIQNNLKISEEHLERIHFESADNFSLLIAENKKIAQENIKRITNGNGDKNVWQQEAIREEAHLIGEHLSWLLSMSDRMAGILNTIKFER